MIHSVAQKNTSKVVWCGGPSMHQKRKLLSRPRPLAYLLLAVEVMPAYCVLSSPACCSYTNAAVCESGGFAKVARKPLLLKFPLTKTYSLRGFRLVFVSRAPADRLCNADTAAAVVSVRGYALNLRHTLMSQARLPQFSRARLRSLICVYTTSAPTVAAWGKQYCDLASLQNLCSTMLTLLGSPRQHRHQ